MSNAGSLTRGKARLEGVGIEYRFGRMLTGGLDGELVEAELPGATAAARAFRALVESGDSPTHDESVFWPRVDSAPAGQEPGAALQQLLDWAERVRRSDVVVSIGIGGSYLGNRVLRDALLGTRYNDLPRAERGDRPQLEFAGFHLDPAEARDLVRVLSARAAAKPDGAPLEVCLLAISKSGTTTETLATTLALLTACRDEPRIETSLSALTAPGSGLAELAASSGGELIPFPDGIGGRFSVLSAVGLSTAAVSGVGVAALLDGARSVRDELIAAGDDVVGNPALLYALLHHLHARRGRSLSVFMSYGERLRGVSEWYVQLLAESLGKARDRAGCLVHAGRCPIVAVGTTDMHAQTQLHQEGPHDKVVTTLDLGDWGTSSAADQVPDTPAARQLAGKSFAALNTLAREANEEALAGSGRPSGALILDRLDARSLGGLLYFLMATVAYEGELMNVNAYHQPGVEAYKKIMKARL